MPSFEIRKWRIEIIETYDLKNESNLYQTSMQYGLTKIKTTNIFFE